MAAALFPAYGQLFQDGPKLVGTGATGSANLGTSVALSADGNTALVGGLSDNTGVGAAWVFTRSSSGWVQQGAKLVPSGAVGAANFGQSVALSSDGNTALIGGPDDNATTVQGAAWVFTRSAGVWSQQGAKLVPTGAVGYPRVGYSVALSADGNTALMGAETDDYTIGAAFVFTRSGSTWSQQGSKLVGSGAVGDAEQGNAVALSSDGNTALIGGFADNSLVGAAWVFTRSGTTWTQQGAKLVGTGAVGTALQGFSVALSGDGATALVGGFGDNTYVGAVWVFTLSGGIWSQQGSKLVGTGYVGEATMGSSVASSANGNIALVGGSDDNPHGAVWVFTRSGVTWTQQGTKLVGSGSSGNSTSQGASVALSPTTNAAYTAITGGPGDASGAGAAWVFAVPALTVVAPADANGDTAFNITVDAEDSAGAFVTGYSDLLHFTSTDGSAILPANSTLTNGTGLFPVTLLTAGNQTITATDTVYSSITATSGEVLVTSAPQPPTLSKAFGAPSIPLNGTTTLVFTVNNPNAALNLTGIGFSDTLPSGLGVAPSAGPRAKPRILPGPCNGTITASGGVVSLSGATLLSNTSCTISVNVTGTAAGTMNNVTSAVTSTEGGTGLTASATLIVVAPPAIAKAFGAPTIPLDGTTSLTFTLTNPAANTVSLTGVAFTDTFPLGLLVATLSGIANTCGGTATAVAGSSAVGLTGGTIAVSSSCTVTVNVTGTASGAHTNTTGAVTSTNGGTGATATANLTVAAPPAITKTFGAASIPMNGSTSLGFVLVNPAANTVPLTGVAFTDNLPAGLAVALPSGLTSTCGGAATAVPGGTSVSLAGATLAVSATCTLSLNVTGIAAGPQNNSVTVTSTGGGSGNTSNASVTVVSPPILAKSFGQAGGPEQIRKPLARPHGGGGASIPVNGTAQLTFFLGNSNAATTLTGVSFTDALPAGVVVSTPNGLGGTCAGGTVTAVAGSGSVSLIGQTLLANTNCTIALSVTGSAAGTKNNVTGAITSNEGGTGVTAASTLYVVAPPAIAKAFGAPSISLNGTTSLTFTLTSPAANTVALNGVAFTDAFPVGLEVATPDGLVNTCNGTATAVAGSGTVSLTGGTIAVTSSCTLTVNVTGTVSGSHTNTTGTVASTNGGTGNTATANLTVAAPPAITKTFGAASIPMNGSTSLSFALVNPALNTIPLTSVAFTDTLPAGLVVSTPSGVTSTCGGTLTAVPGSTSVSLSGATLAVSGSCALSLNVTGIAAGAQNNSVTVTSTEGGAGNTSNASVTVVSPPTIQKSFGLLSGPAQVRKPLARPHEEGPASIPLNGSTQLTFFIANPNATSALTGIAFADTLPSGVVVATPNGLGGTCVGGTVIAVAGSGSVSLSGGTLAASVGCTISLSVTGTTAGTKNNITGAVTSNEGGTGLTASATLVVVAPPLIAKAFGAPNISLNGTTSLTFTLTNPAANTVAQAGVAFTDTFPAGLLVATPDGLVNSCGGTATAVAGSAAVSLTGASIAASASCTLTVTVTGTASGAHTNTTAAVTSTNGGAGNTATANLTVAAPPAITKTFGAASLPLGGSTSLGFVLTNPALNTIPLTGVTFIDTLPAGLVVASPSGVTSTCGGTATAVPGGTSVSLAGATLAANASCNVLLNVTGIAAGAQNNSVTVTSTEGGAGNTSNASLTVVSPPTIGKTFGEDNGPAQVRKPLARPHDGGPQSIPLNGSTQLTVFIGNPNIGSALTGVAFIDTFPSGLVVASPSGISSTCGGAAVAVVGSGSVSLSGGMLAASAGCTVMLNVTGTTAGTKNNVTGAITSNEGGAGLTASATLIVVAPPSIAKAFGAPAISLNGTTSLTFTLTNPAANTVALAGVAFTDTFPLGLEVATPDGLVNNCGGTATAVAGSAAVSLTGASIAASASCTLTVNVTGTASGTHTNTTAAVTSTNGGAGNTATANLMVAAPPAITKTFGAASVPLNGSASLTFVLVNPAANTIPLTGVAFTDNLPAGLIVSAPSGAIATCSGTVIAASGSTSASLMGATLAANSSCTVSLNVTGIASGTQNNSVMVTSTEGGAGNTSNASLTVVSPPTIEKIFGIPDGPARIRKPLARPHDGGPQSIPLNGSTQLTVFIGNPNIGSALTGVAFIDALPTGLLVASPSGISNTCGGTTVAAAGVGSVSLSGGTLPASAGCTISLSVTGATAGTKNNVTGAIASNEGGTGLTASATLTVVAPPSIAKAFGAPAISPNGTTSLTFTLTSPVANTVALAGVAFTDTFPLGLQVATPDGLVNTCGGTATAMAGSGSVSLTGGAIAVASSCTLTVNVSGTASGAYTNITGAVSSTNGGAGTTATAILAVAAPPAITKTFGAASVPLNGSASLTFVLVNPAANTIPLTGLAFTDNLPAGMVVASPSGLTSTCGGTPVAAAGGSSVSLSSATLAASASCTLSLNVTGVTAGTANNSVTVTSTTAGAGNTSTASLTVLAPPAVLISFGAASIPLNGTTTLTFNLSNSNPALSLTGVAFTEALPTGLIVSSPSGLTNTCGGTPVAAAGGRSVSLSGVTIAASGSCSFAVNVTGTTGGTKTMAGSPVTSNQGGTGLTASATLAVVAPPSLAVHFGAAGIPLNGVTSLTYTITNPDANTVALTGVAFTDTFPPDLLVASPNGLSNTCGGGAVAVAGSGSVSLSGATVAAGSSCTLAVNVTVTATAAYTSGPTAVASADGGTGSATSATLTVLVPITFNAPAGLSIEVDGSTHTGEVTLLLAFSSSHTISVATPQLGTPGTRYVFNNWSDGGAVSHTITVTASPATYTATFTTQYQLTLAVTPIGSGTITPVSGGFYNAGATVTLTAVANPGYVFNAWTGAANPSGSATAAILMSGPESVTAGFQATGVSPPAIGGVLNGGSFLQGQAAPNTILSLFGTNLSCTPAPQVLVNGVQAQVLFSSDTQINFVIPAGLAGTGNASVQIVCNGVSSQPGTLALSPVNPSIFTQTENGTGQGAILNLNYSLNGVQWPGIPGSYLLVFVTGFGDLGPAGADGLQRLTLPVTASIGGVAAQVVYAGEAPYFTSGLQQINILIPENAPAGNAVPIQLVVGGVSTQSGVTVVIE